MTTPKPIKKNYLLVWFCLAPLSIIFQLYKFYCWRKPKYPEKTTGDKILISHQPMLKLQTNYGFHELFLNKKVVYQIWCARLVSGITFIKIIEIIEIIESQLVLKSLGARKPNCLNRIDKNGWGHLWEENLSFNKNYMI